MVEFSRYWPWSPTWKLKFRKQVIQNQIQNWILALNHCSIQGFTHRLFRAPVGTSWWCVDHPWINLFSPTLKNDFSTSAFDMQNHQLPHVDSSLLNLKICARIVIQSIPTNQLRPQKSFKFQICLVIFDQISTTIGHFWPLHVESFFKANICPQTESQLPSFLRPTWLNLHPDLSRLQPDYPKIRSRTDQPAQNEGKESFWILFDESGSKRAVQKDGPLLLQRPCTFRFPRSSYFADRYFEPK